MISVNLDVTVTVQCVTLQVIFLQYVSRTNLVSTQIVMVLMKRLKEPLQWNEGF